MRRSVDDVFALNYQKPVNPKAADKCNFLLTLHADDDLLFGLLISSIHAPAEDVLIKEGNQISFSHPVLFFQVSWAESNLPGSMGTRFLPLLPRLFVPHLF